MDKDSAYISVVHKDEQITRNSYFEGSTIIVKNKNDIRELRNITEKSKLHYYDFIYFHIVIIFAASLVVINTLEFVRKNIREFSIHIFCGATKVHIALRIFLQVFIVLLLCASKY
ncbi:hypothetical protein PPOP_0821 [Paenibacillus popilliae ATCC 14706]|uniref:Uncharacterized protein n=2 Tax=Paenibacillus popilliae TaxID=78057 RepID=M9LMP5_PAEPP|nr:hypothetical protein PPOP_0821 [Paenibacillus popilliae ATCC 14706]